MKNWSQELKTIYRNISNAINPKNCETLFNSNKEIFDNWYDDATLTTKYKYKYPYKPAIIIGLFSNINDVDNLFNVSIKVYDKSWSIDDKRFDILKTMYSLIINRVEFRNYIIKQKTKANWEELNDKTFSELKSILFDGPKKSFNRYCNDTFIMNNKESTIQINVPKNESKENLIEFREQLLHDALVSIKECLNYECNLDEILDYEHSYKNNIESKIRIAKEDKRYCQVVIRQYQYMYAKDIKNRDNYKCAICAANTPCILEACHLKEYSKCNLEEEYDISNGITMCRNHHKLFDKGFFTFDKDYKIIVNDNLLHQDKKILFDKFESYYNSSEAIKTRSRILNNQNYLDYHRNNIYKK